MNRAVRCISLHVAAAVLSLFGLSRACALLRLGCFLLLRFGLFTAVCDGFVNIFALWLALARFGRFNYIHLLRGWLVDLNFLLSGHRCALNVERYITNVNTFTKFN